jgi:hydrogenase nickel incorporation protein HypB
MCSTCGCGIDERAAAPPRGRVLKLEEDVLAKNRLFAEENRSVLARLGVPALNLLSSPGAGKTTLLVRTIRDLAGRLAFSVIEGDQATRIDADRIAATGAPAIQINTGKGCHLEAHSVGHAIAQLAPARGAVLAIENVGNLVCPADFDLGETRRVVLLSVTEGDDKPLKYPNIFASADLVIFTKVDLLPHVDFDLERCAAHAARVRPGIEVMGVSSRTGEGLARWYDWVAALAQGSPPA